jgi:hypothetical protein
VLQIDYVFTRYALSDTFDQNALNRRRLTYLSVVAPELFDNNLITWKIYRQTAAKNPVGGQRLFHGFAIHLSPEEYIDKKGKVLKGKDTSGKNVHKLTTEEEIALVKAMVGTVKPKWHVTGGTRKCDGGYYLPVLKKKRDKGIKYGRKSIWNRKYKREYIVTPIDSTFMGYSYQYALPDSVVIQTMKRNTNWKNPLVVEDVTGSMYPYLAQTFLWRRITLATTETSNFVFFNDGDTRPDGPIGKSGGAYHIASRNVEDVEEAAYSCMRKGGGGGAPENNIESLLYAMDKCDSCESVIMIADNLAPVRDMRLLNKVKKPVHIIVCGATGGRIHHNYIEIARKTGGSIHTMEQDITDLSALNEGKVFKIGDQKFRISKTGTLELVR